MQRSSLIVVDRDARILKYMRAILASWNFDVTTCDSGERALACMRADLRLKLVLLSNDLPDVDYVALIRQIRTLNPHILIVMMSHMDRFGDLVAAIRAGAHQVLLKPFLPETVRDLVAQLTSPSTALPATDAEEVQIDDNMSFVHCSPAMRDLLQQAALIARVNLPVLILGESGTGKEVVARYIHSQSQQAKNTFLKLNCAAVPAELLESELFGYEQGAFTGAGRSKPGKFKLCNNGTMFLDEIGEMHPSLQAKLLQVLQDGNFSPLGGRTTEKVNVRILAATNIDMKMAIANKNFREDLYYRLNGFCVKLPPLRERREDIPALLRHFLRRYSHELGLAHVHPSLSSRMVNACLRYDWPGNLRELESFVKRYLVLGDEQLMIDELTRDTTDKDQVEEITPEAILHALQAAGGNRRTAATALGISYKVLLSRLRLFGLESTSRPVSLTQ